MDIKDIDQNSEQNVYIENENILNNFHRCLTMLEKILERLARQNFHNRSQYHEIYSDIENILCSVLGWIDGHRLFSGFATFQNMLGILIKSLADQIRELIETVRPARGKKTVKKSLRHRQGESLCGSIVSMIGHLLSYPANLARFDRPMGGEFEKALLRSFEKHCLGSHERHRRRQVSRRGEKTLIFPWSAPDEYRHLVTDKKLFREKVVNRLGDQVRMTGHRDGCGCRKKYKMCGFRSKLRKIIMPGGRKQEYRIRMVRCADCGQKFSLLPSFIPREKHFSINIIGQVIRDIVLFSQSVSGALENVRNLCGRKIGSRQTIFHWLQWMGFHHPTTVLTRAGVTGSGYFQEDEGFEKEPALRTYTAVMVDPETMVVWHIDYVDRVDEKTLTSSFEEFVKKISFKVLGISKDAWKPATDALKSVFHGVWIGFCHLHCLKKMSQALREWQKETGCDSGEADRLYKKFKNVLKTATSEGSMRAKMTSLNDKAFEHPLLKKRVDDLKDNAVRYTSHKKRNGITTTTSMADNFLKIIKRKLRQVSSFRDKNYAKIFFQATACIRNFVPFLPGAKNAHKSPFMLAGGETYDLPWAQVMNVYNAFLFTDNAF